MRKRYDRLILFYRESKRRWFFPIIGIIALIWFLLRVIPKPSRASYPCQRAAFPVAAAFVIYFTGILGSSVIFRKSAELFKKSRYVPAVLVLILALLVIVHLNFLDPGEVFSKSMEAAVFLPNQPIGESTGEMTGKVVWVWNPDAVDETCPNTWREDQNWYMPGYTNLTAVQDMLSQGLLALTGTETIEGAWSKLFMYYNQSKGKDETGYSEGEKIAIKVNFVTCDDSNMDGHNKDENLNMIDTSPQVYWSVLNQLINVVGVRQEDISIGDPGIVLPRSVLRDGCTGFPQCSIS